MRRKYIEVSEKTNLIYNNIDNICKSIKIKLEKEFDIIYSSYLDASIKAVHYVIDDLSILEKEDMNKIKIEILHGEFIHNYNIQSYFWSVEHYIIRITSNNDIIYIDPSSFLMHNINRYIGSYYVSDKKPWYLLLDEDNIRFKQPFKFLNDKIRIKFTSKYSIILVNNIGIINFIQYEVWGVFSDFIRSIKLKKK